MPITSVTQREPLAWNSWGGGRDGGWVVGKEGLAIGVGVFPCAGSWSLCFLMHEKSESIHLSSALWKGLSGVSSVLAALKARFFRAPLFQSAASHVLSPPCLLNLLEPLSCSLFLQVLGHGLPQPQS